jgi:3-deoxy-D-manno-octulosonate 8-phosphate phosphatase (KDO 8-P phosphatase)
MIKLLVLDVDGCLSDGKLIYSADGIESKSFNVKDGLGITTWIKMGHSVAIITGRNSTIVKKRADELGIEYLFQGIRDKDRVLNEIVESLGLHFYEVAAIGDDLNDYKMLQKVGRSFTPANGVKAIKSIVDTPLLKLGGEGAIREMIDILVQENDQEELFLSIWI